MPLSIWRRPSLRTAGSSSSPLFVNGVTSAVPAPVNAVLIILPAFLPFSRPARPLPALPARVPPVRSVAEPQNVVHVEPAAPADNPLRGKERATREGATVAGRVRQCNRIGRTIETHRVHARDEANARG